MPRYRLTRDYANDKFSGRAGDVVEMDAAEYERLCNDSPDTFEEVEGDRGDVELAGLTAEDVLGEEAAAVHAELTAQTPTLDIDPEDKAKEIPGEGNKYTPASGYVAPPSGARVVERAPADRQQKAGAKRGEADAGATSADTSASARVTAEPTPASKAADKAQLAGGVTAQTEEDEEAAKKRREEQEAADKAAREQAAASRAPAQKRGEG